MSIKILGTGSFVPVTVETNDDLVKTGLNTTTEWIIRKTGIEERPISQISVSQMASIACQEALENSKCNAEEIELIILATSTPDMLIPSSACLVQREIKASNAACFDLNNACSGFVYAFDIATKYIKTNTYKKILIIGSDVSSKITNKKDRNTAIFFADGAGAMVLGQDLQCESAILSSVLFSKGDDDPISIPNGGCAKRFLENKEELNSFYLRMNGKKIWDFATKILPNTIEKLCYNSNIQKNKIDWIVAHQANKRIIEESMKILEMPIDKAIINIEKRGNTIAATIPIAFDEAVKCSKIKRGDYVAMVGFGAGLSWGGVLLRY
jgi:3-oxoacyl-[acyl-carrier-protein] synthase-3